MHISSCKDGTYCAMNQTNTKAICYSATNSNYDFYVSLVNPFVVLQSHGYGKQLNLHVKEMKKYMLMEEKILILISLTSWHYRLSYAGHISCTSLSCRCGIVFRAGSQLFQVNFSKVSLLFKMERMQIFWASLHLNSKPVHLLRTFVLQGLTLPVCLPSSHQVWPQVPCSPT